MANLDKAIPFLKYESEQHRAITAAWYAGTLLDDLVGKMLAPFGISPVEFRIMRILMSTAPQAIPVYTIKHYMPVRSDISRTITSLHNRGLVEKKTGGDDKRVVPVVITQQGIKLMEEAIRKYHQEIVLFNVVPNATANETTKVLEQIIDAIQKALDKYDNT